MAKKNVLIVDDEPDIRELLEITLGRMGINTDTAANVRGARDKLTDGHYDLCLTDMKLPDGTGVDIIQFAQKSRPELPIAMITAFGSVDTAIEALKAGAFDFVSKPIDLDRLRGLIDTALKLQHSKPTEDVSGDAVQLHGNTEIIQQLRQQIGKLARSQAPVYISGESGSGKEVVARLIHARGARSNKPFVPVNCGAIPSELMESEFFGHAKGSFTGAFEDKLGLFQAATGGTLFLDEVADLPLPMQVKLLRAIQEKAIRKVGSNEEISIDVRILSATHKDLAAEVQAGRFRSDLFYRINVIELRVPPLRERRDDIVPLANTCLEALAQEWQLPKPKLTKEAEQALLNYGFPGNVRELENILERAYTLCENNTIHAKDLQLTATSTGGTAKPSTDNSENVGVQQAFGRLEAYLEDVEKQALGSALEQCRWNKTAAAEMLGISFRQLRYRLKKLGME